MLFSDCCCSLYVIIALLASHICSLQIGVFWSSLHAVRCTLFAIHCAHFADDSMLRATSVLLFAFGYWLFASRCSVFVFRCLALVSRLLAAHYLQNPARYSLLATHGQLSLLSSRLMSSTDCCKSLRIDHPCWRCDIRFSTRKYPPH